MFWLLYNFWLNGFLSSEEMSEIWSKIYIGLHVKYSLFLSDFKKTWISSTYFRNFANAPQNAMFSGTHRTNWKQFTKRSRFHTPTYIQSNVFYCLSFLPAVLQMGIHLWSPVTNLLLHGSQNRSLPHSLPHFLNNTAVLRLSNSKIRNRSLDTVLSSRFQYKNR